MRGYTTVLVAFVCGLLSLPAEANADCTDTTDLRNNYVGEFFDVSVDDNTDKRAPRALKGNPDQPYVFSPSKVTEYNVTFLQPVELESLQFHIKLVTDVRIEIFDFTSEAVVTTIDENGLTGNGWQLKSEVFNIDLDNVGKVRITWVDFSGEVGIKKLELTVCNEQCENDSLIQTDINLNPPSGFNLTVPEGPSIAEPLKVLKGSGKLINLKQAGSSKNYIKIVSTSAFNIGHIFMDTKNGKGMEVTAYTEDDDTKAFFTNSIQLTESGWNTMQLEMRPNVLEILTGVKRLDIKVFYPTDPTVKVKARNLYFYTCL